MSVDNTADWSPVTPTTAADWTPATPTTTVDFANKGGIRLDNSTVTLGSTTYILEGILQLLRGDANWENN